MLIEIDFASEEAIYLQVRNQIIYLIAAKQLKEGDNLPSVRRMAEEIGINMHTVNKAYSVLKDEGFVHVDRRRGAVVCVDMDKIRAKNEMKENLQLVLAMGRCKQLTKDDVHAIVDEIFEECGGC